MVNKTSFYSTVQFGKCDKNKIYKKKQPSPTVEGEQNIFKACQKHLAYRSANTICKDTKESKAQKVYQWCKYVALCQMPLTNRLLFPNDMRKTCSSSPAKQKCTFLLSTRSYQRKQIRESA